MVVVGGGMEEFCIYLFLFCVLCFFFFKKVEKFRHEAAVSFPLSGHIFLLLSFFVRRTLLYTRVPGLFSRLGK